MLDALCDEHELLLDLLDDIERSSDRAEALRLWDRLTAGLRAHVQKEVDQLRPILAEDPLTATQLPRWDAEHLELAQVIRGEPTDPRAAALLRAHLHAEEHDLFPAAAAVIDPSAWERSRARTDP
jgi:hypothetical protein